jgi:glycosyltransferase involved in cell wall biosynthesis
MKRVLIVASHYPPTPEVGGVIRVAKLVKYLPSNGWEPLVITTTVSRRGNCDDELYQQIADVGRIYRVPRLDVRQLFHGTKRMVAMLRFLKPKRKRTSSSNTTTKAYAVTPDASRPSLASLFMVPDYLILWALLASVRSLIIGWFKGIDVIYATSPLQSGLLVGYVVKKLCRVPLIVEMRDPWTTNPFAVKRLFRFLEIFEKWMERVILSAADRVVVINGHFIEPILEKHPSLSKDKFVIIPNGFDEDDFKGIVPIHSQKRVIVHAGTFYQGRSGLPFLQAFAKAVVRHTWVRDNWEVKLVGSGEEYRAAIEELGIAHLVDIVGTVPHSTALQHVMGADLLLLVPGGGLSTMTGKLFEYLAAKRPIIVLSNDSAAARLVDRSGMGSVVPPDNVEAIAETLVNMMEDIQAGNFVYPDFEGIFSEYERKGIARRCVRVMEDVSPCITSTSIVRK